MAPLKKRMSPLSEPDVHALQGVCQLLSGTINSPSEQVRKHSEEQLKSLSKNEGFVVLLLRLLAQQGVDGAIQQSAAIYLKNTVVKRWPPGWNDEKEKIAVNEEDGSLKYFVENDRQALKDQLFSVYMHTTTPIRFPKNFSCSCWR